MDLLSKFNAVTIQADNLITEDDRDYCIAHQKAYDVAHSCFHELVFIWEDLTTQQSDILTDKEPESYGMTVYLPSDDDLKISTDKIKDHIKSLHTRLIRRLVQHFNQKYHVSVDASEIDSCLLPEKPSGAWRYSKEKNQEYEKQMLSLHLNYQDILNKIFVQLDRRNFREQALYELKERCHDAAWNDYSKTPKYEIKKDILRFTSCGCSYDGDFRKDRWKLQDYLKQILQGIVHYDSGSFSLVPSGFSNLLGYNHSNTDIVQFPSCTKVRQLKMFKNGRVDIKFSSEESARTFVAEYLGLVY